VLEDEATAPELVVDDLRVEAGRLDDDRRPRTEARSLYETPEDERCPVRRPATRRLREEEWSHGSEGMTVMIMRPTET
jgi:hypothetical protein